MQNRCVWTHLLTDLLQRVLQAGGSKGSDVHGETLGSSENIWRLRKNTIEANDYWSLTTP
jgi:hypothetical protein